MKELVASDHRAQRRVHPDIGPEAGDDTVPDKLLDQVLKKLDATKEDLEKNWLSQIVAVSASLGMMLGLGEPISRKIFDTPGYENVLYLVFPMVNLYLVMRFGGLASAFSETRFAAEALATKYFFQQRIDEMSFANVVRPSVMFQTNSYFEYFHHRGYNIGVFLYSLFVPIVLSINHATSLYLLLRFFGLKPLGYGVAIVYCLPIVGLYVAYYRANRQNPLVYSTRRLNYLMFSNVLILMFSALLLYWALQFPGALHL
jgi:hypothetical protein